MNSDRRRATTQNAPDHLTIVNYLKSVRAFKLPGVRLGAIPALTQSPRRIRSSPLIPIPCDISFAIVQSGYNSLSGPWLSAIRKHIRFRVVVAEPEMLSIQNLEEKTPDFCG